MLAINEALLPPTHLPNSSARLCSSASYEAEAARLLARIDDMALVTGQADEDLLQKVNEVSHVVQMAQDDLDRRLLGLRTECTRLENLTSEGVSKLDGQIANADELLQEVKLS